MNKRHEEQLWSRLDSLYVSGVVFMSWDELYHWYGTERLAKAPWRDIKARWESLLEEKGEKYRNPKLRETRAGVWFITFPGKELDLDEMAA